MSIQPLHCGWAIAKKIVNCKNNKSACCVSTALVCSTFSWATITLLKIGHLDHSLEKKRRITPSNLFSRPYQCVSDSPIGQLNKKR